MKWITLNKARDLPTEWDSLTGNNLFLTKKFLDHLERANPCQQTYNLLWDNQGTLVSIYVDYHQKLDLFTYSRFSMKAPVTIIGIPCSVSKPGFSCFPDYREEMLNHVRGKKGLKVILNTDQKLPTREGATLPTCQLKVQWESFDHYISSMRSHYRYRLNKAIQKWEGVSVCYKPFHEFTETMYRLYEQVFDRSKAKLEKLSYEFFRNLPLKGHIIEATYKGQLLGFCIVIENKEELIFLFIGMDYVLNPRFDTYLNLLIEIINYGINNDSEVIDFGQTAEETKLKLGATLVRKGFHGTHSSPLTDFLALNSLDLISYKPPTMAFNVFKKGV